MLFCIPFYASCKGSYYADQIQAFLVSDDAITRVCRISLGPVPWLETSTQDLHTTANAHVNMYVSLD